MNRVIPIETKVKTMEACMSLNNAKAVAIEHGVSEGSIYYWYEHKVRPALSDILVNEKAGPKKG